MFSPFFGVGLVLGPNSRGRVCCSHAQKAAAGMGLPRPHGSVFAKESSGKWKIS